MHQEENPKINVSKYILSGRKKTGEFSMRNIFSMAIFIQLTLMFLDTLFQIKMGTIYSLKGFFVIFLFNGAIGFFVAFLLSLTPVKAQRILSLIFLVGTGIYYSAQMIYYSIFKTLFTFFSMKKGGQVLEFYKDILLKILFSLGWILLVFVPIYLLILFIRKKQVSFVRGNSFLIFMISILLFITALGWNAFFFKSDDAYAMNANLVLNSKQMGLLATMGKDMKDHYFPSSKKPLGTGEAVGIMEGQGGDSQVVAGTKEMLVTDGGEEEAVETFVPKPQVLAIDFDKLIREETDPVLKDMHEFFKTVPPTYTNQYTGLLKDYNFIFITAESFSDLCISKELTPTLYKMQREGIYMKNFYNPIWGVSTSDGEYTGLLSMIPKPGVWSMLVSADNNVVQSPGNLLRRNGYTTFAYHNHDYDYYDRDLSHPNLGYDYKGYGNGLDITYQWPESDLEMMEATLPEYVNLPKFHVYYMSVSGHMRYSYNGNMMSYKNRDRVEHLNLSDEAKAYIACNLEFEDAMTYLLKTLEEAGVADKTLIVINPDHYPYGLSDEAWLELADRNLEDSLERYRSAAMIYCPSLKPIVVEKACSSLDLLPTAYNLLGIDYDSRMLSGRDILSDSPPLVVFVDGSFIMKNGRWFSILGETKKNYWEILEPIASEELFSQMRQWVSQLFYYAITQLETDYQGRVITDEVFENTKKLKLMQ